MSDYINQFNNYRRQYLDYPCHVHIETIGMCNARCVHCPNSILPRRKVRMSNELFANIIEQLKAIPASLPLAISPFKVNEPLLDKTIFDKIALINNELPHAQIWFTTNLNAADQSTFENFSQIKNLGYIWISLNSLDQIEYFRIMGLELKKTVANIISLLSNNRSRGASIPVVLARVGDSTIADENFVKDAIRIFKEFEQGRDFDIAVTRRGEWLGYTVSGTGSFEQYPCCRWFELSITCTGEVAFCCMDGECKYPLGNINTQPLLEIYNAPLYRRLREQGSARSGITPCKDCSFM